MQESIPGSALCHMSIELSKHSEVLRDLYPRHSVSRSCPFWTLGILPVLALLLANPLQACFAQKSARLALFTLFFPALESHEIFELLCLNKFFSLQP